MTRNREDAAVRRGYIIDQALRIVGELGYYGFTIQALAERCGISNAGLLYHFGSKDKLLLALLDEIETRVEDRMAPFVAVALGDAHSIDEAYLAVSSLLRAMVDQVLEDQILTRFVAALQLESMDEAHPAHGWFRDRERETIALFTQVATPWTDQPVSAARQLHALMQGLGHQWLRADTPFDLAGEWEKAFSMVLPPRHGG